MKIFNRNKHRNSFKHVKPVIPLVLLILTFGVHHSLLSQSTPCILKEYKVQYIDSGLVADSIVGLCVYFSTGFSEKAKVFFNDKLVFKGKLVTNPSLGMVKNAWIVCKFPDQNIEGVLRIQLLKNGTCGEFQLERNYRYLAIHYYRDEWVLQYSNVPPHFM